MVSPYTHHTNSQLSTLQTADTTAPPPIGWFQHTHSISTGNSVQCNQQTHKHHSHLDCVDIHTPYHFATQYSATSRYNTTSTWIVSTYIRHFNSQLSTVQPADTKTPPQIGLCQYAYTISTRNSVQCHQQTQQHHIQLDDFNIHTKYQVATQYSANSRHINTTFSRIVSTYIHHINSQLITVQPARTKTPHPLGLCQHTYTISTRNSVQYNQQTQQHHLHLDGVTIYTQYQLANQ